MRVEYTPTDAPGWKYPWGAMRTPGDFFDIPPGNPKQQRGVRNAAHLQRRNRGRYFLTKTLPHGVVRVMLLYTEASERGA